MFRCNRLLLGLALLASVGTLSAADQGPVSFAYEIRPILSRHCGACHGPDEAQREADLRLDTREGLLHPEVVTPGKPEASELIFRIFSEDEDEIMPPPDHATEMSEEEKALLQRWVAEGADYAEHWSFVPLQKPVAPQIESDWIQSPIDAWVLERLQREGLEPAPPADPESWLRRVTIDLTGLPPTLEEQDAFLADSSPAAREKVVDRLLATHAYGERMANDWLDVARYADTYGRHEDATATVWPYRDWVIRAFRDNLPYDDFVVWQTAGDLLPNPTRDQRIATCFNRLAQQSNEAGSNPEEFRIEQVADRMATNGMAFLGLTMDCARCHDHKFDPLTMRDYYGLSAFFNNIDELGLFAVFTGGVPPPSMILHEEPTQARLDQLSEKIAALEQAEPELRKAAQTRFQAWLGSNSPPRILPEPTLWDKVSGFFSDPPPPAADATPLDVHYRFETLEEKQLVNEAAPGTPGEMKFNTKTTEGREGKALIFKGDNVGLVHGVEELRRFEPFSFGIWINPLEEMSRATVVHRTRAGLDAASRGMELVLDEMRPSFALAHFSPGNEIRIRAREPLPVDAWTHITCSYDGSSRADGLKLYLNGDPIEAEVVRDNLSLDIVYREEWGDEAGKDGVMLSLCIGWRFNDANFRNGLVDDFRFLRREVTAPEARQWALLPETSSDEDWFDWYLREHDAEWQAHLEALKTLRAEVNELNAEGVELMVMEEMDGPRRATHLLNRGAFDQPVEEVRPDTPSFLPAFPEDAPRNRLGLAQWLVQPDHPLTSRVAVNRFWQIFFGRGLVATSEDFGTQGQMPSHPRLLDDLSARFVESGWDVKALCREIALSSTYAQSSEPLDAEMLEMDPDNALLSHGPRRRLTAEQIRDLALVSSELLHEVEGGPSVKPYQPAGLWDEAGTQHVYVQDHGEKLYQRSLYTFWRRTLPPPAMTVFDAPTREFCQSRRLPTSTPLQALVLMNDVQFIEAARVLAENLVRDHPEDPAVRARTAFRLLTSRRPSPEQVTTLTDYLQVERDRLNSPQEGDLLLAEAGEHPRAEDLPVEDVVATTLMVRLLYGLTETTALP